MTDVTSSHAEANPVSAKRSGVEGIKENSRALRGTIAQDLQQETDHFSDADKNLLKFHGTYQQEDRDAGSQAGRASSCTAYSKPT